MTNKNNFRNSIHTQNNGRRKNERRKERKKERKEKKGKDIKGRRWRIKCEDQEGKQDGLTIPKSYIMS